MKREAPSTRNEVLVSGLLTPPLKMRIVEVLQYDTDHDAWEVRVETNTANGMASKAWVRSQRASFGTTEAPWRVYDMSTPIPAKVARD